MAQIVGQVELEVVPNDRNFNRNLQQIIDKAANGASTKITPTLDVAGAEQAAERLRQTANTAADQATAALSGIRPSMDTSQFDAAAAQIEGAAEATAGRASDSFAKIAVGVGVAAAAMYGLKQASDVVIGSLSKLFDNLLKAQAGFEAILGKAEGNRLLADIQEFARVTPFSTEGLVQYSQQLLGVGRSAESIIPTLQSVGDLVASKGGDTNTINRVLFTLTQIQSVGRLIGQDALQLQSALIPITKLLADSMGKTQAEIKKLSAAGKISADTVFKTLEEAGLDVAGAMDGATRNIAGAKEGLIDTVQILAQKSPVLIALNADIVQAIKNLTEFLGSDRVSAITDELSTSLESLYKSIQPVFSQLSEVSGDALLTLLEAATPLISTMATVISTIPVPVLTALGTLLAFNKFQTFVTGFGKVVELFQNFQGLVGRVAAGLSQSARALASEQTATAQAAASNQNLAASYRSTAAATAQATAQVDSYTAALGRQRAAAASLPPPTAGTAVPGLAAPGARTGAFSRGGVGGAALGAVGFLGLTQRDSVDGVAGQLLGVGATTATATALGAQVGGPYGAAIGAAAGLGFGIFQEFNRAAREEAAEKAEEWGEIGAESAAQFVEAFNREFNVDPGGNATQSERIAESAQIAADVAVLKEAARTGVVGEATKAAAGRLNVTLEIDSERPQLGITETPGGFTPAGLASRGLGLLGFGGEPEQGEFIDRDAFSAQIADLEEFGLERETELKKQREVIEGIIGNPLAVGWFDEIRDQEIAEIAGPFGALGELFTPVIDNAAGLVLPFDLTGRSLDKAFDRLQSFGISLEDAVKLGDKIAFYFSDVLDNIQGSVDESTKWNTALDEARASLEGINKERIKEASTRLGLLNQEEEFRKKIQSISENSTDRDIAQIAIDSLKLAENQAAQAGGTIEEIAARQNQLFATALQDIQEQGELTDEQFRSILQSIGLLDDFDIASQDQIDKITELREEAERLRALQGQGLDGASRAAAVARISDIEAEIEALEGLSTAESRAQNARDRRNASALQIVKANESIARTYNDLGLAALLGEDTLSQFGDAAVQAFELAALKGEDTAETNQLFVDSLENIQFVLGLTDSELREYLASVGLLDQYNKSLADSSIGVQSTISDLADQYQFNTDLLRTLLGVSESVDNDITIYVTAETEAALANLRGFQEEYQRIQNDASLTPGERYLQSREVSRRSQEAREALEANGVDINATAGALAENERRLAEEAAEKAAREAEKIAKENERIAAEAERAAEALKNSIDSASNTLQSAIESAAEAIESAADAWKSDIKERTQYDPAVSASRLTANATRQGEDLAELTAGIGTLRARGVSQEVLDALGIDNVADLRQVRKLVNSDDADLARLTQAVTTRDNLATTLAKREEEKRNRDNITAAIVAAAAILGFDDFDPNRAASISNQINIDQGADVDALTSQILGLLSGGKINR